MRRLQIALLALGVLALLGSAAGIGKSYGETLYNTGIALLLIDVVGLQLWPTGTKQA